MAAQVEARSLSELNYLAANPPQYPVNPAQEQQEPLTLYISRVPGTRDVILSTLKPQRKNVTGEDIANSLYYVHLDQLSDGHLAAPQPVAREPSPRSSAESAGSTNFIHCRAYPANPSAAVSALDAPPTPGPDPGVTSAPAPTAHPETLPPSSPPPPYQPVAAPRRDEPAETWVPPGFRLEQAPTLDSVQSPDLPPRPPPHQQPPSTIRRKPVAPRAADSTTTGAPIPAPQPTPEDVGPNPRLRPSITAQNPSNYSLHTNPFHEPVHGPTPGLRTQHEPNPARHVQPPPSSSQHHHGPAQANLVPFGLTIIRRDPSSGHQWNVGKATSYEWEAPEWRDLDPEDAALRQSYPANQPGITVHLQTSGYAKFRGLPTRHSLDPHLFQHGTSSSPSLAHALHGGDNAESGFTRQVVMSYGRTWTSNVRSVFKKRHFRSDSTDEAGFDLHPPHAPGMQGPGRARGRNNSTSSNDSTHSNPASPGDDADDKRIVTQPGPGLRPKGYVFLSPWDGACEFRTGSGGRSLKCRHTLPSSGGTFNPLVLAQDVRDGRLGRGRAGSFTSAVTGTASVSELRFNLPSADLFSAKGGTRDLLPAGFDKFLKLEPRRGSMSGEEEDGPYGMDMGKERAGGGNRGKRAKLGKLIIYPEGLKMMDLVVASNIGIWWGAWEKSF